MEVTAEKSALIEAVDEMGKESGFGYAHVCIYICMCVCFSAGGGPIRQSSS